MGSYLETNLFKDKKVRQKKVNKFALTIKYLICQNQPFFDLQVN